MFVILASVSSMAAIAVVLYYNAAVDISVFEKIPGGERANAAIAFHPESDEIMEDLRQEVAAHRDVRKAQYLDMGRSIINDIDVRTEVMADYTGRETRNVYKGIFPRHSNEIALSGLLAGILNKGVGDTVLVGRDEIPYIITGLTQGMDGGFSVYFTFEGKRKIAPDFRQSSLMIYLNSGVDAAIFVEEMESKYSERSFIVIDMDKSFAEGVSGFASIIATVGLVMLVVAGFVVILVLYFVISSAIIRKRRELGIQKAVGYTTLNQMNQVSVAFVFPLIFGTAAGCVIGAVSMNPLMSFGMSSMGIMRAEYIVNPVWIAAAGVCIVMLSYLTSMLITWRIRKISAYSLVSE